jgi:hypothetical protein
MISSESLGCESLATAMSEDELKTLGKCLGI